MLMLNKLFQTHLRLNEADNGSSLPTYLSRLGSGSQHWHRSAEISLFPTGSYKFQHSFLLRI